MNVSKVFEKYIEKNEDYRIAYDIVRRNSEGRVWLIGGAVSRNLNRLIYGVSQNSFDFDFIVEESAREFVLPNGWMSKKNSFGNPKFVKGNMEIDYIPIKTVESILRRNLDPTIENVLMYTPFTIQALAYDAQKKKVIGETGLGAFRSRTFEVNDPDEANILSGKYNVVLNDLILEKAESMEFEAVLLK